MPQNPIAQVVTFLVAGLVLIGAVFMGFVILAVLLGLAFVLGLIFWVRLWWFRRKLRRAADDGQGRRPDTGRVRGMRTGRVIEVEYEVVEERDSKETEGG